MVEVGFFMHSKYTPVWELERGHDNPSSIFPSGDEVESDAFSPPLVGRLGGVITIAFKISFSMVWMLAPLIRVLASICTPKRL